MLKGPWPRIELYIVLVLKTLKPIFSISILLKVMDFYMNTAFSASI